MKTDTALLLNGLGDATFIAWDSIPNPDNDWNCLDWKIWHQELSKKYGRAKANELWEREWQKQGGLDYSVNWCKYNSDWVEYFESVGLDKRSIFSMVFTGAGKLIDTADNVVDAANNTSKMLKWALPLVILGVGAGAIWYVAKNKELVTGLVTKRFGK